MAEKISGYAMEYILVNIYFDDVYVEHCDRMKS